MGNNKSVDKFGESGRNGNNNPEIPSFIFSSGTLAHDPETPLPTCCENPGDCRGYVRKEDPVRTTGMYCKQCHAEWLDRDIYPSSKFDEKDLIAVDVVKLKTANFDPCQSAAFNVSAGQRFLLARRVTTKGKVRDLFRCFLMAIPQRTLIGRSSAAMNSLKPGDHVMWHRPYAVWHHQLIRRRTGRFRYDIIHFGTTNDQPVGFKGEVVEEKARNFDEERGILYKVDYCPSVGRENPEALVFDRANAKLHERGYSLLTHNCEHVIFFCKTGVPNSFQGNWLKQGLWFLVLRIVIISLTIVLASLLEGRVSVGTNGSSAELVSSVTSSSPCPTIPYVTAKAIPVTWCYDVRRSQLVEGIVVPCLEVVMFAFVVWRHHRALREHGIACSDFTRRVGEAMLELFCTVAFYLSHLPFTGCVSVLWDIVIALAFGITGKVIGFFLGPYLCQKTVVKRKRKDLSRFSRRRKHFLSASYDAGRGYSSMDHRTDHHTDYHSV